MRRSNFHLLGEKSIMGEIKSGKSHATSKSKCVTEELIDG
jgi:hypothetical protein